LRSIFSWHNTFADNANKANSIRILKAERERLRIVMNQIDQIIAAGEHSKDIRVIAAPCGTGIALRMDDVTYEIDIAIPWTKREGTTACDNLERYLEDEE
jgi:hypothetical protein